MMLMITKSVIFLLFEQMVTKHIKHIQNQDIMVFIAVTIINKDRILT